jgi:hypothetical protein
LRILLESENAIGRVLRLAGAVFLLAGIVELESYVGHDSGNCWHLDPGRLAYVKSLPQLDTEEELRVQARGYFDYGRGERGTGLLLLASAVLAGGWRGRRARVARGLALATLGIAAWLVVLRPTELDVPSALPAGPPLVAFVLLELVAVRGSRRVAAGTSRPGARGPVHQRT